MFQYTAARRRLDCCCRWYGFGGYCFNTQPPEGGWPKPNSCLAFVQRFQHTAARRRLVWFLALAMLGAACFNTQPPEGGW